jgi:hypothetical protein
MNEGEFERLLERNSGLKEKIDDLFYTWTAECYARGLNDEQIRALLEKMGNL